MKSIELKILIRWSIYYSIIICSTLLIIFLVFKPFNSLDIKELAHKNYYENFKQKENQLNYFINFYETSLIELGKSEELYNYIQKKDNKKLVEKLFFHYKKSFPDIFQIRYLDNNGLEKIRIDGDPISIFNNDAKSRIVENKNLQNKSEKDYFKKFIQLNPMEIGYSKIDLNKDFGKVTIPKMITLRMAIAIYGNNKKAQGVLIYNISLNKILNNLSSSTLYNISLINNEGYFLTHYNNNIGILSSNSFYKLKNELPKMYKDILGNDEFSNKLIFSRVFSKFNKSEKIKIVLQTKEFKNQDLKLFSLNNIIFILCTILFFPLSIYALLKRRSYGKF